MRGQYVAEVSEVPNIAYLLHEVCNMRFSCHVWQCPWEIGSM